MPRTELAQAIDRRGLYKRQDGAPLPASQIASRAANQHYKHRFELRSGEIRLRAEAPGSRSVRPPVEPDKPAPSIALTENDVVAAVCSHLEGAGFRVTSRATTLQRGVDIRAQRDGVEILVEAKGATSSKPGTNRFGKPFSGSQAKSHVARALYTASAVDRSEATRAAIALPDTALHRRTVSPIQTTLNVLGIATFWVAPDGKVEVEGPWQPGKST